MVFKISRYLACAVIAATFVVPVGILNGESQNSQKDWTLIIYWDADNSLEYVTEFAMSTWESTLTSNADINIVALIDLLSVDGIDIYEFVDGERQLVDEWEEMNTADPATLEMFVEYALSEYPSEKSMLVLQDHGFSWRGILKDETNGYDLMSFHEVAAALENVKADTGKNIDVLALDACNMASIETFYELRNAASYVVGSETTMSDDGLPYQLLISDLLKDPGMGPAELATTLVNDYVLYYSDKWAYEHQFKRNQDFATMAAFDMGKMEVLGDAFVDFTETLAPIIPEHMKEVEEARGYALIGDWCNMAGWEWNPDLVTFAEGLRTVDGHPELDLAIDNLETAFDAACIAEAHSRHYKDTVHGLHIWFPPSLAMYNSNGYAWAKQFVYNDIGLDIVDASSWDACLMAYFSG